MIINTLDRAASLARTLGSLDLLRYPRFEVIVVHGPCSDGTSAVLERWRGRIRTAACAQANLAMSRNLGLALAAGEIVAFLDDDAIPEPDWLDHLVEGFADPRAAAVGGFLRDPGGVRFQYRYVIADRFGNARLTDDAADGPRSADEYLSPTGANVALRRDRLLDIGGFDEAYAYFLDETDVNLRLHDRGWRLALAPQAEVHHKYLENIVRHADRRPKSRYVVAYSKAYFAWTHGRARHGEEAVRASLDAFRESLRLRLRRQRLLGRVDRSEFGRLLGEIDRGLADGARRALAPPQSLPRRDSTVPAFHPFVRPAPAAQRLRLCVLCARDPRDAPAGEVPALYAMARALARRGHEVSVLCPAGRAGATIDFADGLWLHALGRGLAAARLTPPVLRTLGFVAAARREIDRVDARRQWQALLVTAGMRDRLADVARVIVTVDAAASGAGRERAWDAQSQSAPEMLALEDKLARRIGRWSGTDGAGMPP